LIPDDVKMVIRDRPLQLKPAKGRVFRWLRRFESRRMVIDDAFDMLAHVEQPNSARREGGD
jgi:hypothetical protein